MYDCMYLLTNVLATYTIYKFIRVFFEQSKVSKEIEIISYLGYYVIISLLYFWVDTPIVRIISNLILFFLLTQNYNSTIHHYVGATILIFLTLICIENVVILFSNWNKTPLHVTSDYASVIGIIAIRILSFASVMVISGFKNIKAGKSVPALYWICIIFIPSSLLVLLTIILNLPEISRTHTLLATAIVLTINIAVFYLYDAISENTNIRMRELLLEQKNKYYSKQYELMKTSLASMSNLRHDLKNHLPAIYALVDNNDNEHALKHIAKMIEICDINKKYANSGNVNVDSILNFKLQEAEINEIAVTLDLSIPEQISISSFDMAIILGNLLDNAICANQSVPEERYIKLNVKYEKGRVFIDIDNPYICKLLYKKGKYYTTKDNAPFHGIGLESVKTALERYDGLMTIMDENNIFSVRILMYTD